VEENGTWRKRCNLELYKVFNEPDIISFINMRSLEWSGHLVHVSENTSRMIKKIIIKAKGTRKVGRPRLRWEEYVWQDIRILGVKNWRSMASNREELRANSEEGQGPHRAALPMLMMMMMNATRSVLDNEREQAISISRTKQQTGLSSQI
jgi:hypothetical protein